MIKEQDFPSTDKLLGSRGLCGLAAVPLQIEQAVITRYMCEFLCVRSTRKNVRRTARLGRASRSTKEKRLATEMLKASGKHLPNSRLKFEFYFKQISSKISARWAFFPPFSKL